ncbi:glycosyltransferase family 2 protein [Leclercia sp. W6]|nr:glycosyltransferase family 2 protein [Leclercia sp. W6]
MKLNNISFDILQFFKHSDTHEYVIKTWTYKNICFVVDFSYKDIKFALDFIPQQEGKISVDLIKRSDKSKFTTSFDGKKERLASDLDVFECLAISLTRVQRLIKEIDSLSNIDVSIIVPVYNREKLILDCIDSINSQTFDRKRFEVIFVDDNSKDKSIAAIEYHIDKNINYKIIKRSVSSGNASAPRNEGIKSASGRYVFFLDSDDTIHPDLLSDGIEIAKNNNSDIVYFKQASSTGRGIPVRPFKKNANKADITKNHLFRSLKIFKMFRREMLIANNILFTPSISVYEDMIFSCHALTVAENISVLSDKDYYILNSHDEEHLSKKAFSAMDRLFVLQTCFLHILLCKKDDGEKTKMYNAWLIICIEILVIIINKKNLSINEKMAFFNAIHISFSSHSHFVDINKIYGNQQKFLTSLLDGDFKTFCSHIN